MVAWVTLSNQQHDYTFSAGVTLEGFVLWNNHPNRNGWAGVRKGLGHWTLLKAVETPVPDSKSIHPSIHRMLFYLYMYLEPQFFPNQVPGLDCEVFTFQNQRMSSPFLLLCIIPLTWSHSFFPTKCPAFPPQQDFDWNKFAENIWWDGKFLVILNHKDKNDVHVFTNPVHTLIWSGLSPRSSTPPPPV